MPTKLLPLPRSLAALPNGTVQREHRGVRIRQVVDRERTLEFTLTTLSVNRYGEVDKPDGGRFDNYLKNPVVLFCHNAWDLPVGRALEIQSSPQEVIASAQFAGDEQAHPFAETLYRLYRDDFMRAVSIGFKPITVSEDRILPGQTGITILEWELLEFSCCPVPANPDALKRFIRAWGLPPGATEQDLAQACRLDPRRWFQVMTETVRDHDLTERRKQRVPARPALAPETLRQEEDGTEVQTLILAKETFETKEEANKWITDHDFVIKEGAPDETENSWRYRQFPPGECVEGGLSNGETFATIEIDDGVQGAVCKRGEESAALEVLRAVAAEDRISIMERMQAMAGRRMAFVGTGRLMAASRKRFFFLFSPPSPGKDRATLVSVSRDQVRVMLEELRKADPEVASCGHVPATLEVRRREQHLTDENLEKLRQAHSLLATVIMEEEAEPPAPEEEPAEGEEPVEEMVKALEQAVAKMVGGA